MEWKTQITGLFYLIVRITHPDFILNIKTFIGNEALVLVKGVWSRLADMQYPRHGTQAIAPGKAVFTLAGSPALGGGSQKNMEYLGRDIPAGTAITASDLFFPDTVYVPADTPGLAEIKILNGNVGFIIKGMEITRTNADNFEILSGRLSGALLK